MGITSAEIAKLANVSRTTVHRVIYHKPNVKPEVAARVNDIIEQYEYSPNLAGKALVKQNNVDVIGVILPKITNGFYEQVKQGVKSVSKEYQDLGIEIRYEYYEYIEQFSVENQLKAIDNLKMIGVDAIAIVADANERIAEALDSFKPQIPIVSFISDIDCKSKICFIGNELYKSGAVAAELISKMLNDSGNVLLVATSLNMAAQIDRIKGFKEYLSEVSSKLYVNKTTIENYDNEDVAYQELKKFLGENPNIDAIYFSTAYGLAGYAKAMGELKYQKKIRVIASDLIPITRELLGNGMVDFTICQQPFEEGALAIRTCVNYLTKKKKPKMVEILTKNEIFCSQNL
ncbi:LacI family transcriptional regulator [Clostridia bacterium]|nr:LacI family transcriptional regulator [Clostridia bacterium]